MPQTDPPSQFAIPSAMEPRLIAIPEGSFLMGSDIGQECESPVHRVWIGAFALATTQVTNAEYEFFLRAANSPSPPNWQDPNFNHPQQPVVAVSWLQASEYCEWLAAKTSRPYRLPTEAEWERAARGGLEQKQFPWGDDPPQSLPDYSARWQTGPDQGQRKSSRGGSWRHQVKVARCSARSSIPPEFQYADYGFRLACDLSPHPI